MVQWGEKDASHTSHSHSEDQQQPQAPSVLGPPDFVIDADFARVMFAARISSSSQGLTGISFGDESSGSGASRAPASKQHRSMTPLGLQASNEGRLSVNLKALFPSVAPLRGMSTRQDLEEAHIAIAIAAAAAQRQQFGFTPGDRVGDVQMNRDYQRDRVVLDGISYKASSVPILVRALAIAIRRRVMQCACNNIYEALRISEGDVPRAEVHS